MFLTACARHASAELRNIPTEGLRGMPADGLVGRSSLRKESAIPRWDTRVKRWAERTSEPRTIVEFEHWVCSELMEGLTKPERVEKVDSGDREPFYPKSTEGSFGGQHIFRFT